MEVIDIKRKDFISTKKTSSNFISKKLEEVSASFDFLAKVNFGIDFKVFKIILLASSVLGFLTGIVLNNLALSLVLAISIPILEIEILYFLEKEIRVFIEGSIIKHANIIKNSYLHTEDVKTAITDSINRFESPIKELFEEFKSEVEVYHFSVEESLSRVPLKIKSKSLEETIEQLILCNKDKTNMSSFIATVEQLNDKLVFLQNWSNIKKSMIEKYLFVLGMVICMPIITIYSLDVVDVFLKSSYSKIIIAVYVLFLLVRTIIAIKNINQET